MQNESKTAGHNPVNDCVNQHIIRHSGLTEIYINAYLAKNTPLSSFLEILLGQLKRQNAEIVKCDIFSNSNNFHIAEIYLNTLNFPIMRILNDTPFNNPNTAIQIHAISNKDVKTLFRKNRPVARMCEDGYAQSCFINNVLPSSFTGNESRQTAEVFETIEEVLNSANMNFSDIKRTWFYNDGIVRWYPQFNDVRNNYFQKKGILKGLIPASTCVGGKNLSASKIAASVMAVKPKSNGLIFENISSPLQCDALRYHSSFSRAIKIDNSEYRKVFISGTASISAGGETAHRNNLKEQIKHTLTVTENILKTQDMNFSDVYRSVAYLKNINKMSFLKSFLKDYEFPVLIVQSDVCRNDLLFEIELDAGKKIHKLNRV